MPPNPQECNLLVVSDLHLSEGRHGDTKKFSRHEDFFFDEEFARFLAHYQDRTRWNGAPWHLVVNGDFLDFLQVVTIDGANPELRSDPKYGLACGEAETVFKIGRIASGHRRVFEALARFVSAGNLLTIVKGNHDVEFHYAGVQRALLGELQKAAERAQRGATLPPQSVLFAEWFHYEKGLVWIEHGNRYEGVNSFRCWLAPLLPRPPGPTAEIDLPLGSMFFRYLFNRVEWLEPFADNIKPVTEFVRWMLRKYPSEVVRFLMNDGRTLLRKLRRAFAPQPAGTYDAREAEHRQRLQALAAAHGIEEAKLEDVDALRAKSVFEGSAESMVAVLAAMARHSRLALSAILVALVLASAVALVGCLRIVSILAPTVARWLEIARIPGSVLAAADVIVVLAAVAGLAGLVRWALRPERTAGPSYLLEPAARIAALLGVQYVLMGHTHDAELSKVPGGGEYFNTGTWTKVFSEEERLIREDVELVFVQGLRRDGTMQMKLLEWNDAAGEPRLLKLFEDGRE